MRGEIGEARNSFVAARQVDFISGSLKKIFAGSRKNLFFDWKNNAVGDIIILKIFAVYRKNLQWEVVEWKSKEIVI